jgi:hypothetical protein
MAGLGHVARRRMRPLYIAGLIGAAIAKAFSGRDPRSTWPRACT